MPEEWLTVVDAAFRMQQAGSTISWRTISKYRDSLRIPSQDQGGIGLVRISDVVAYELAAGVDQTAAVNHGVMKTDMCLGFNEL